MSNKAKILIIDDDEASLASTKLLLEFKYDILTASNPDKAHNLLKKQACNLIILDIFMPNYNGMETLKDFHSKYPKIPILVVSGSLEWVRKRNEVKQLGALDYLLKPFDINMLQTKILESLENTN